MRAAVRRHAVDIAVPVALVVLAVADRSAGGSDFDHAPITDIAWMAACAVPLLWRRRHPLWAALAYVAVSGAYTLGYYVDSQPPFEPFVAGVVAFFALGAHAGDRQLRVGVGISVAAMVVGSVPQLTSGQGAGDVFPAILWWGGAIAAGRFVRSRQHLVSLLGDRAARLEREREEQAVRATLEERARIARELHDVIAHSVSVMVIQAGAERRALPAEQTSTHEAFALIERTGRDVLAELRRLLGVMRAPDRAQSLAPQPSLDALDALVAESRRAGQQVEVRVEGDPRPLPAGIDLAAYRIVQEALTNARRHAPGARADVTLRWAPAELGLEIVDDGPGPRANGSEPGGHGLVGMRERATLYGGSLSTGPAGADGRGFHVRARLPVERAR